MGIQTQTLTSLAQTFNTGFQMVVRTPPVRLKCLTLQTYTLRLVLYLALPRYLFTGYVGVSYG